MPLSQESKQVEETHAQSPSETLALWSAPKLEEGSNTLTRAAQRFPHALGRLIDHVLQIFREMLQECNPALFMTLSVGAVWFTSPWFWNLQ